jgi:hypothetical protein
VDNVQSALFGSTLRPTSQFGTPVAQLNGRVMQLAARITF